MQCGIEDQYRFRIFHIIQKTEPTPLFKLREMSEKIKLDTIEEAIEDFRAGKFIIVVDDEDRENEGDLIVAAEKITPD